MTDKNKNNNEDISDLFEDDKLNDKELTKICEENSDNITCGLAMTIPSNVQYEIFKPMTSITVKKDKRVPLDFMFKFSWDKVQKEIFKKYNEITNSLKDK